VETRNHSSHGSLLWLHVGANGVKISAATPKEAHDAVVVFHRDGEWGPVSKSERPVRLDVGDEREGCYDVARAVEANRPGNARHELRGGKLNLHCYKEQRVICLQNLQRAS
jgi:hypothetical protein